MSWSIHFVQVNGQHQTKRPVHNNRRSLHDLVQHSIVHNRIRLDPDGTQSIVFPLQGEILYCSFLCVCVHEFNGLNLNINYVFYYLFQVYQDHNRHVDDFWILAHFVRSSIPTDRHQPNQLQSRSNSSDFSLAGSYSYLKLKTHKSTIMIVS